MLKNTFKPTLRRLLRDKPYLLVSILSLATGLLCCLLIFKYVLHEWSYDRFHQEADRIYRLELEIFSGNGSSRYAQSSIERLLMIPDIEMETRFARIYGDMNVEVNGNKFIENNMIAADSVFFQLFSFGLYEGYPQTVLTAPNSVVLSRSIAQKYFKSADIVGETLIIRTGSRLALLTITGIMEDVPTNSHLSFDIVTSEDVYKQLFETRLLFSNMAYTYIRTAGNVSPFELEKKINVLNERNSTDTASTLRFHLKPITDIHLHSSAIGELSVNSNVFYVYLFLVIAFIILGIASVNFATLVTARSVRRAREMGMRKVFGSDKSSLITAFLVESVLLSFAGLLLAYLFVWFFLPHFNQLTGNNMVFADLISADFLLVIAGVTILSAMVAVFYPALVLSRQQARSLLKENIIKGLRGDRFWKSMVIIQFAISIILISATYIIHKQIDFIFTKDPGFDKEQIITFPNYYGGLGNTFVDQLKQHPDIEETTVSSFTPGTGKTAMKTLVVVSNRPDSIDSNFIIIDSDFIEVYGIPIIEGRNFSEELASDSTQAFILNKTAINTLGWTEPIGKKINAWGRDGYVIGVVEDFHFLSLHNEIGPIVFLTYGRPWGGLSVKIRNSQRLNEILANIEETWNELLPGIPFRHEFVDEQFAAVYEAEQRAQSLFFSFSVLAITIAVLGLFSFTSYMIRQKTREIGIRKVLGATLYDILKLFYTGYAKLLLIAALFAVPAGYLWMRNWLENFAYRTEIGADVLLISFGLILVVLLLSVSFQIIKGALQNPAEVIRAE